MEFCVKNSCSCYSCSYVLTDQYICYKCMLSPTQTVQVQDPKAVKQCLHQPATYWKEYWEVNGQRNMMGHLSFLNPKPQIWGFWLSQRGVFSGLKITFFFFLAMRLAGS